MIFAGVTLDGFMKGSNNDPNLMVPDEEFNCTMTGELKARVDTIVIGRRGQVCEDLSEPTNLELQSVQRFLSGTVALVYKKNPVHK